jgi:hypothetical protein
MLPEASEPVQKNGSLRAVVTALLLSAVLAGAAHAQIGRRGLGSGLAAACFADYTRLCQGVAPGGGRIITCLNVQADKLSQPCFEALAERGLAFAAALRLCRADFEKLCPGVPTGMGRALGCLLDNRPRLSSGCDRALEAHGFSGDDDRPVR